MMKVLMIHTAYNELPLLKYKLSYCKKNNFQLYIIDNISNDGTKEWLEENNIAHSFVDTNNSFNLIPLLDEMQKKVHEIKPDWFIYSGVDLFFESDIGIQGTIKQADILGYNQIETIMLTFYHTGDGFIEGNPFCNYFHYQLRADVGFNCRLICKYSDDIQITPDSILMNNISVYRNAGICFEMQASKPIEQRVETYLRRQKAWNEGMNKVWGTHYLELAKQNFLFDKKDCLDIRDSDLYALYKRLQKL